MSTPPIDQEEFTRQAARVTAATERLTKSREELEAAQAENTVAHEELVQAYRDFQEYVDKAAGFESKDEKEKS